MVDKAAMCKYSCNSASAKLGKGQGAKKFAQSSARTTKIWAPTTRQNNGHSLERERPKFGHNPACERNKIWVQFVLWAIDENMGTNLQALYSSSAA